MNAPTILVCGDQSNFADDVSTRCAGCRTPIVHRPHAPADSVKMCGPCAAAHVVASGARPAFGVTAETLREIALLRAKTDGTH